MSTNLTQSPTGPCRTFLDFPLHLDLDSLDADIAILGIPYGKAYYESSLVNDQSLAPDALRQSSEDSDYTKNHHDWDLGGPLLDDRDIKIVDCGNVTADKFNTAEHYNRAESAVRQIFKSDATLISLGGDHGIPIPILRGLEAHKKEVTLVQIDAHIDWRDEVNGEHDGYSSPIRRASEMSWIKEIIQIGIRGVGSARTGEVDTARAYGADIITAYEMHEIGIQAVLDRIPDNGNYYLTVDADGLDPSIMPGVMAQTPGGLNWFQARQLVHGLVNKGRVLGMDIVEIAPSRDVGNTTMVHAERLICNFIGATVRAGYFD